MQANGVYAAYPVSYTHLTNSETPEKPVKSRIFGDLQGVKNASQGPVSYTHLFLGQVMAPAGKGLAFALMDQDGLVPLCVQLKVALFILCQKEMCIRDSAHTPRVVPAPMPSPSSPPEARPTSTRVC